MPELMDNNNEADKNSEGDGTEGNDLALERVSTAEGGASNAEGSKPEDPPAAEGGQTNPEGGEMAMVPIDGVAEEEGVEDPVTPKPPATVSLNCMYSEISKILKDFSGSFFLWSHL